VLGDRLLTLHISDNDGIDERHWLPGQGIINWPGFIRALESSNYAGAFVYETTSKTGPGLHALAEVRENFSDLLEKAHKN
jgi:sugar phosphate isomerase/epimerase